MNAALLLEHYAQIADAPDAIARLRRFILDLAVRGKLVEQNPNDEPASELLKRIADEKARLLEDGKASRALAKASKAPLHEKDERQGWVKVEAAELFPTRSGNSKLIKGKLHSEPGEGRFPGYSAAGQDVWLDHWEHQGTAIILSAVGARCGKAFLANGRWSAVANTHIIWLMPAITQPEFAMLHLNNEDFWARNGGAQPFVKVRETLSRPFALPPLAEQQRIVAKADELMALCDQLETARAEREAGREKLTQSTLAKLNEPDPQTFGDDARFALEHLEPLTKRTDQIKQLRQTILNLAVRGKLVEQDPNDEPASELLKRIEIARTTRAKAAGVRSKRPIKISESNAPSIVPASWALEALGNLVDPSATISYGVLVPGPDVEDGIPLVRAQDLSLSGHAPRPNKTIAPEVEASYARTRLKGGEILLCVVGSIGKLGIAPASWAGANIARAVARIAPIDLIASDYILLAMRSELVQRQFAEATRTLAQPTLNVSLIEAVPIPLPPLAEQHRIVAKVDELMVLCDQLEANLVEGEQTRSKLLEAVLHKALEPVSTISSRELEVAECQN